MKMNDEIPKGFVRVTEVLERYNNFSGIDQDVLANAADRGSRVHTYCELYSLGLFLCEVDEDCKNYVEAYQRWFDIAVDKVIMTEKRMNHKDFKISGKFDLIVRLKGDGGYSLIDIKTPQTTARTWQLQTAAYQIMASDCLDIDCERRICIRLPKYDSVPRIFEYKDYQKDLDLFLSALNLDKYFRPEAYF